MKPIQTFTSDLSKKEFPLADKVSGKSIRTPILELMKIDFILFILTILTVKIKTMSCLGVIMDMILCVHKMPTEMQNSTILQHDTVCSLNRKMQKKYETSFQ